jgi:hypothetical protein
MKYKNQVEVEIKYGLSFSFAGLSIDNPAKTGVKLIIKLRRSRH